MSNPGVLGVLNSSVRKQMNNKPITSKSIIRAQKNTQIFGEYFVIRLEFWIIVLKEVWHEYVEYLE